jgi:RNA polymerase sigma-70 factor (ECF subfamily)
MQVKLQEALNSLEPLDREVLALRHFEQLSNSESAQVLGIKETAAGNRYVRALQRLKQALSLVPGFEL